jgi:hypothetical protein
VTVSKPVADYNARAILNRPQDAQAIRATLHELRGRGFGDYEIASATALSVEYVRRVLGERQLQEAT